MPRKKEKKNDESYESKEQFILRSAVVYKGVIYLEGDEDKVPEELKKTLSERYKKLDEVA